MDVVFDKDGRPLKIEPYFHARRVEDGRVMLVNKKDANPDVYEEISEEEYNRIKNKISSIKGVLETNPDKIEVADSTKGESSGDNAKEAHGGERRRMGEK